MLVADLRTAIGFSSFTVLFYYAVTNLAALDLSGDERTHPRWISMGGLLGCIVLAVMLPIPSVLGGTVVLLLGAGAYQFLVRRRMLP